MRCFETLQDSTAARLPTNKETAVDALRPGESEGRLQDGFVVAVDGVAVDAVVVAVGYPGGALIEDHKGNPEPGGEFLAEAGYLEKRGGPVVPRIPAGVPAEPISVPPRWLPVREQPKQVGNPVQDNERNSGVVRLWLRLRLRLRRSKQARKFRSEKVHQVLGIANPVHEDAGQAIVNPFCRVVAFVAVVVAFVVRISMLSLLRTVGFCCGMVGARAAGCTMTMTTTTSTSASTSASTTLACRHSNPGVQHALESTRRGLQESTGTPQVNVDRLLLCLLLVRVSVFVFTVGSSSSSSSSVAVVTVAVV